MDKAIQLFIAETKNQRTINIIAALLNDDSAIDIAKRYDVTRQSVYLIKAKYID